MSIISDMQIKIGADASSFTKELERSQKSLQETFKTNPIDNLAQSISGTTDRVGGLITKFSQLATVAAGGFGLTALIGNAVQAGESLYQLSNRLQISTSEAAGLSRILSLTGGDVETAGAAFMRLDKSLSEGGKSGLAAQAMLDAVGVSLTDSSGKLLPLNEQLKNMAAGFRTAQSAGYGQEFIMQTLGVRGMALTKTLQGYTEAAANAAKVKGIGLNVEEMHQVNQEMQLLKMEAAQLGYAGSAALIPVARELLPEVMTGLTETARFLGENKTQVAELTKSVLEAAAAYEIVKTAKSAGTAVSGVLSSLSTTAEDSTLTAAQEKSIDRRIAMIERSGEREIKTYMRSAEYLALAEEEKVAAVDNHCIQIEQRNAAMAAKVRADMTAAYAEINAAAATSGEAQVSANTSAAESANISTEANGRVAKSELAKGEAATAAGAAQVKANGVAAESANLLAGANAKVGVEATASGIKATGAISTMSQAASKATSVVWGLVGGWTGLAIAIGFAVIKLHDWQMEELQKEHNNTVNWNGETYVKQGEDFYKKNGFELDSNSSNLYNSDSMFGKTSETAETGKSKEDLEALWKLKQPESPEDLLKKQRNEISNFNVDVDAIKSAIAGAGDKAEKAGDKVSEAAEKLYQVQVPIGYDVYEQAQARVGTPYEWGGAGDDLGNISTDCGKLVLDSFRAAGIQFTSRVVPDMVTEAGAAYHSAASGYVAKQGDAVVVPSGGDPYGHIVISDGRGGYIGANSSTGVQHHDSVVADFGTPTGYISTADLTGGKMVSKTMTADAKAAAEALGLLNKAKEEYANLYAEMSQEITKQTGTEYEAGMSQVNLNLANKQKEINKLAASGLDVSTIKAKFAEYGKILKNEVTDKWQEAVDSFRLENQNILTSINHDYEAAANVEYEVTVNKLKRQRDDKLRSVAQYKDDMAAQKAVDDWYNNSVIAAAQKKDLAILRSHQKMLEEMANLGNSKGVVSELNSNPGKQQQSLDLEGQKDLAKTYVDIWNEAHTSTSASIAAAGKSVYNTLSNSITEFISGTKSAMDVVHDFGNLVLQTIAEIVAKRAAANIVSGLLGSFIGGGTANYSPNVSYSGGDIGIGTLPRFAAGGVVTAPTIGLIAEAGQSEAVIPLSQLSNVAGNSVGVQVNITNNSNSEVKVENSHYDKGLNRMILDVVINGAQYNTGGFSTSLRNALAK